MDWVLIVGIGLLLVGVWVWFQRNRPTSPLLYDDALIELYSTIQTLKAKLQESNDSSIVLPTPSKRMILSYVFQGQEYEGTSLFIHNLSLTIPKQAVETQSWNLETQKSIASFVCAVLEVPSNPTVHTANDTILSINYIFSDQNSHEKFLDRSIPDIISLEPYKATKFEFDIDVLPIIKDSLESAKETQTQS